MSTAKRDELYEELRTITGQVLVEDLTVDDVTAMLLIFYRIVARKAQPKRVGGRPRLTVVSKPGGTCG